jgi:hypothetical protein
MLGPARVLMRMPLGDVIEGTKVVGSFPLAGRIAATFNFTAETLAKEVED